MHFLLIHSPLVGPAAWRFVADQLGALGHQAAVPDLRSASARGDPHAFLAEAQATIDGGADVVAGHSGAGQFLPSIGASAGARLRRLVFVDAGVPACVGSAGADDDFMAWARTLAVDGVLPPWSTWWDEGVMEYLIPDEHRRRLFEAELPAVPYAFYEAPVELPEGWCGLPGAYVLLSEGYRRHLLTARSRGWPEVELRGAHLDLVNHPEAIATALVALAS
ncbi:MAG TPA: alpha/beta hydrolase [Acidimicrobiia bacterium]|nr:alpha/beta hydrolase [Acidimicrobiia bacterium]